MIAPPLKCLFKNKVHSPLPRNRPSLPPTSLLWYLIHWTKAKTETMAEWLLLSCVLHYCLLGTRRTIITPLLGFGTGRWTDSSSPLKLFNNHTVFFLFFSYTFPTHFIKFFFFSCFVTLLYNVFAMHPCSTLDTGCRSWRKNVKHSRHFKKLNIILFIFHFIKCSSLSLSFELLCRQYYFHLLCCVKMKIVTVHSGANSDEIMRHLYKLLDRESRHGP